MISSGAVLGAELVVVTVSPPRHGLAALATAPITVEFDQPVDMSSVGPSTFRAFGRWSGPAPGGYTFANDDRTVTLHPDQDFFFGEHVMVILSHDLKAAAGASLRSAGYSWQFWTAAAPATLDLSTFDILTTRTVPTQSSRAYGGIATDLNNDGFTDLTIVNEDTADLRVFLNLADGTGAYAAFMQPTFPVNDRASPSEPTDFDGDGFADICVANINTNSVSILLGQGDGTFGPQQEITVGAAPRGIAVLDVDGDGDVDIANTNSAGSNLSILINDGAGVFGAPIFHEGGGMGEWALAAADMNDDGILDLVVGARTSQTIIVNTGNGDRTFTVAGSSSAGGAVWMLGCGDVDGDGTEDVAAVNSSSNNGAILLGDGLGNLSAPDTYGTDPFPLATDLGDLNGDGRLDWVTSSFAGDWWVFTNDGDGTFSFDQERPAPQAASCALLVDIDNDADLDLAAIDELADVVILEKNAGTAIPGDLNGDGTVGIVDFLVLLAAWGPCPEPCPPFCPADANFDCQVGVNDFLIILANWTV
ncbi:MAG: FG-GAP-like repeat-containing protein [Planctomycetota bacterium]